MYSNISGVTATLSFCFPIRVTNGIHSDFYIHFACIVVVFNMRIFVRLMDEENKDEIIIEYDL